MKRKSAAAGFSLIEVLAAITILGLMTAPLCGALVLAARLSQRSDVLLQARLQVTSTVETLMAEGVGKESDDYGSSGGSDRFPGVTVKTVQNDDEIGFDVTVTSDTEPDVSVDTYIRLAAPDPEGGGDP